MKNCRTLLSLLALAAAIVAIPSTAGAQTDVSTTQPITVQQKPAKAVWMKATVVHADANSMIVREEGNEMAIHTFTFAEKARNKMENVIADGGYQSGDAVKILWLPGTSEALNIKGRPSKAI